MTTSFLEIGFLSNKLNNPASNVPEIECHTQETAQIIADSGVEENCALVVAILVARPAFCIPTSIEIVRFFALVIPVKIPAQYPKAYPRLLCKKTAIKIVIPETKNFSPCEAITPPTTQASPKTATPGIIF